MLKKSGVLLVAIVLMFGMLAAAPRQARGERQEISYLGVLAKGYPDRLVAGQLARAGVKVAAIEDGLIIFSIGEDSKPSPFFSEDLPFLEGVYLDRQAVLKEAKVARTRIAREFMANYSRKRALGPRLNLDSRLRSMEHHLFQGAAGITRGMWDLDRMIARKAVPASTLPKGADDDIYEDNDSYDYAAEIGTGTFSNLQNFDDDWYKLAVSAGQDLVVEVSNYDDNNGNLYLYLYNGTGNQLSYSTHADGFRRAVASNLAAGYYYIYVNGNGNLSYDMKVETGNLLGWISGHVSDESSGPINGLEVNTYDSSWNWLGATQTDAGGDYSIEVYPSDCYVYFYGMSAGNYLSEYYNNKNENETPDTVTVAADSTTTNIDAQLASGGSISGRVTAASSGAGLENIRVRAYDSNFSYYSNFYTDSNGYYSVQALTSGSYKVQFYSSDNYVAEWYNDKSSFYDGDPVSVTQGSDTPDIDAQLVLGGTVSGHVQDTLGGPVNDIPVETYDASGIILTDWTDSSGDYAISRIPPGNVRVFFHGSNGGTYADEWYNDKRTFTAADPVTVTSGGTASGINAVLPQSGVIAGRVTNGVGDGIANVYVKVFDGDANQQAAYAHTDGNGFYIISGLYPDSYKVWFDAYYTSYASEWYNDKGSFDAGDAVVVTGGVSTQNIDATLLSGGGIAGYVNNPTGGGIQGVLVAVYDLNHRLVCSDLTDWDGYYSVSALPAGLYKMYFDPAYTDSQYIGEWYLDKTSFEAATPITVSNGAYTQNTKTFLSQGTRIFVTSPASGSTWFTRSLLPIAWSKIGAQNAYVKIQLFKGTALNKTLILKTANDGSFDWTIPAAQPAAANYRVKIITSDSKVSAYSSYFAIAKPSITVTAPASGTTWSRNTGYTITWTKAGTQAATVKIQLFRGTTLNATLSASTANDGSFDWTVPAGQALGTNYKIKITTTDSAVSAFSGLFTIN